MSATLDLLEQLVLVVEYGGVPMTAPFGGLCEPSKMLNTCCPLYDCTRKFSSPMPLIISYDFTMGDTPDLSLPWPEKHSKVYWGQDLPEHILNYLPENDTVLIKAARGAVQIATGRLIAIISAFFGALASSVSLLSSVSGPKGADVIEQDRRPPIPPSNT
jgi:hypothetical protein